MTLAGLPHSDTHGLTPACGYPWLFAADRVLLRLLIPRHSPCALCSLTIKFEFTFKLCESRVFSLLEKNNCYAIFLFSTHKHCSLYAIFSILLSLFYCSLLLFSFQGSILSFSGLHILDISKMMPMFRLCNWLPASLQMLLSKLF